MATATTPLIERQALAELNTLRDAPGWIRLASHLLTIVLGGVLWRLEALPLALRLVGLLISGIGLATCFAPLHECGHRTAFRSRRLNDAVAWWMGLLSFYNADAYRRYHQWHHRYTHQPGLDPELEDPVPTTLAGYLRERGLKRLFFTGLATDFCVAYSAIDAAQQGFKAFVVMDACRAIDLGGSLEGARSAMQAAGVGFVESGELV